MMKWKQKLALSLCAFYAMSIIGFALSMHFCGGKLANVSLYSSKASCKFCKTTPVEKTDDGCCKNTKFEVKVKDSHHVEAALKLPQLFSIAVFLPSKLMEDLKQDLHKTYGKTENKAPPGILRVAIHVFNCVFRN